MLLFKAKLPTGKYIEKSIDAKPGDIYITGDLHGEWGYLNTLINKKQKEMSCVLQCGDFGYWPNATNENMGMSNWNPCGIKNNDIPILFSEGNHEDYHSLYHLKDNEICPNVFWMPRMSTLQLPDGRIVLFCGGADSIDKADRIPGFDWFREETIKYKDMMNLPETKVDIIISHTCPNEFNITPKFDNEEKLKDPSREALSQLLEIYHPSLWFFGHWHTFQMGKVNNCQWVALNMSRQSNWWIKL